MAARSASRLLLVRQGDRAATCLNRKPGTVGWVAERSAHVVLVALLSGEAHATLVDAAAASTDVEVHGAAGRELHFDAAAVTADLGGVGKHTVEVDRAATRLRRAQVAQLRGAD